MGLADDLAACERAETFDEFLDRLPPADREAVDAALANPRISATRIAQLCTQAGFEGSAWVVRDRARKARA